MDPMHRSSAGIERSGRLPAQLSLLIATVLSGLSAGFFFTYAASVTAGLAEIGDTAYVETFQAINETIRNPAFAVVFFGSVPAIALAAAINWRGSTTGVRVLLVAALVCYLAGFIVTVAGNVPLNEELAEVTAPTAATAATARADFEAPWNQLNLIRSFAFGASFVAMALTSLVWSISVGEADGRSAMGQTR